MVRALTVFLALTLLPLNLAAHPEDASNHTCSAARPDGPTHRLSASSTTSRPGLRVNLAPLVMAPAVLGLVGGVAAVTTVAVAVAGVVGVAVVAATVGRSHVQDAQESVQAAWLPLLLTTMGVGALVLVPTVLAATTHTVTVVQVGLLGSALGRLADGFTVRDGPVHVGGSLGDAPCGTCPFEAIPPPCGRGEIHTAAQQ
ncbi:MAG: hypothetical protein AB2A00_27230 [Myxococcota bacterium]